MSFFEFPEFQIANFTQEHSACYHAPGIRKQDKKSYDDNVEKKLLEHKFVGRNTKSSRGVYEFDIVDKEQFIGYRNKKEVYDVLYCVFPEATEKIDKSEHVYGIPGSNVPCNTIPHGKEKIIAQKEQYPSPVPQHPDPKRDTEFGRNKVQYVNTNNQQKLLRREEGNELSK